MLFLLSSSSLLLLLSLSSSSFYFYYYYYYYYHYYYYYYHYYYSVNNIPYQCDINCAGHFTLDALASRPVACLSMKTNWNMTCKGGQLSKIVERVGVKNRHMTVRFAINKGWNLLEKILFEKNDHSNKMSNLLRPSKISKQLTEAHVPTLNTNRVISLKCSTLPPEQASTGILIFTKSEILHNNYLICYLNTHYSNCCEQCVWQKNN